MNADADGARPDVASDPSAGRGAAGSSPAVGRLRAWVRRPTLGPDPAVVGWVMWVLFAAVVCSLAAAYPDRRSVTPEYFGAGFAWIVREPLYRPGPHGYLYLPHAAVMSAPFAVLPPPLGDVAWRVVILGVLATGLRRVCEFAVPRESGRAFALVTMLTIAAGAAGGRNGQANVLLAGIFAHAAAELSLARWGRASAWLWLGFAWKPVALVPILLAGAAFPAMIVPLMLGAIATAALPFLASTDWRYVVSQYREGINKVLEAGTSKKAGLFCELNGLLTTLGVHAPSTALTAARLAAAIGTLLWCLLVRRTRPSHAAFALAAAASWYLMLFNPRTETNSYVILAPWVALASVWCSTHRSMPLLGWTLAGCTLLLGFADSIPAFKPDHVVRPTVALVFGIVLAIWSAPPPSVPPRFG